MNTDTTPSDEYHSDCEECQRSLLVASAYPDNVAEFNFSSNTATMMEENSSNTVMSAGGERHQLERRIAIAMPINSIAAEDTTTVKRSESSSQQKNASETGSGLITRPSATFNISAMPELLEKCRNVMEPVKSLVDVLNSEQIYNESQEEVLSLTRLRLVAIGDHIEEFLLTSCESSSVKQWNDNLWNYVAAQTEMDAKTLYRIYKHCLKKVSNEDKIQFKLNL